MMKPLCALIGLVVLSGCTAPGTGDEGTADAVSSDARVLLQGYFDQRECETTDRCDGLEQRNLLPADADVRFEATAWNLSVEVPYNAAWGTDFYRLPPGVLSENGQVLSFGPLRYREGGIGRSTWVRSGERSPEDILETYNAPRDDGVTSSATVMAQTDVATLVYVQEPGMCEGGHEIVGPTGNYTIYCTYPDDEEVLRMFHSIKLK